jgi:hypothetical protein
MSSSVVDRDRAVHRLSTLIRAVTAAAIGGAGMVAIVAARTAPGRRTVHTTAGAPQAPVDTAAPTTDTAAPATAPTTAPTVPPTSVTAAQNPTSRTAVTRRAQPVATLPPTTARPILTTPTTVRTMPPVRTTLPPVVTSGGS